MRSRQARSAVLVVAMAGTLAAAACAHLSPHWPWHRAPSPPAAPVHELDVTGADGADAFPQYWRRNTLLVDLSAASGAGTITLKPAAGRDWPVRLAFRVTPGAIGVLEVRAAQRLALPIAGAAEAAGRPVDLELPPGVYISTTAQMTVRWGPAP